jgi:hypothetical protein
MIGIAWEFVERSCGKILKRRGRGAGGSRYSGTTDCGWAFGFGSGKTGACSFVIQISLMGRKAAPLRLSTCSRMLALIRNRTFRRYRVLHKCANPSCLSPFRRLSQGKLFLVETEPLEGSKARRAPWRGRLSHHIEYYWLCDQCAFALTLSYEKGRGVVTVPRPDFAKKRPATVHAAEMPRSESGPRGQLA